MQLLSRWQRVTEIILTEVLLKFHLFDIKIVIFNLIYQVNLQ